MASDHDRKRSDLQREVADEEVYELPCSVPFKVFLRPDPDAEQRVIDACSQAAGVHLDAERQPSSKGNFVCLRLTLHASRMAQISAVRDAINTDPAVIMAL